MPTDQQAMDAFIATITTVARGDDKPLDGWRRTTEDQCEEWIRNDNRVCMRQDGVARKDGTPGWRVYARAEQSGAWDLGHTDTSADGIWPPVSETHESRRAASWWAGMLFAPLAAPLPAPSWAPRYGIQFAVHDGETMIGGDASARIEARLAAALALTNQTEGTAFRREDVTVETYRDVARGETVYACVVR